MEVYGEVEEFRWDEEESGSFDEFMAHFHHGQRNVRDVDRRV